MRSEKKIYVVVATHVHGANGWPIHQPVGRVAAQVAHVVSKMRVYLARKYGNDPITTLILSVPSLGDLYEVATDLRQRNMSVYEFEDDNEEYYRGTCITAICTEPTTMKPAILQRLPLWDGR